MARLGAEQRGEARSSAAQPGVGGNSNPPAAATEGAPRSGRGGARKPKLGQNFLRDRVAAERIVTALGDGTQRTVHGYRAVRYEIPPGCAAGYMPELNVLCGIADFSTQSEQPVTKHLVVEVTPGRKNGAVE